MVDEIVRTFLPSDFCILLEFGAVAQLGERLICIQEVAGSIPTSSTSYEGFNLGL